MKKNNLKRIIGTIFLIIIIFSLYSFSVYGVENTEVSEKYHGEIIELLGDKVEENQSYQLVSIEIIKGDRKGEIITAYNFNNEPSSQYFLDLRVGNTVLFYIENDGNMNEKAVVSDFAREYYLLWPLIVFVALMLIIGWLKGLKTLISLAVTLCSIIYILIPQMIDGKDPLLLSLGICLLNIFVVILLTGGFKRKSVSALLGTIIGIAAAGALVYFLAPVSYITGIAETEYQFIDFLSGDVELDMTMLLLAGIIIGVSGAIADITYSVASKTHEIHEHNLHLDGWRLFRKSIENSREIMGTISYTMIIAYLGAALPIIILMYASKYKEVDILSNNLIAAEILRVLAGGLGILLTVPFTILISMGLLRKE